MKQNISLREELKEHYSRLLKNPMITAIIFIGFVVNVSFIVAAYNGAFTVYMLTPEGKIQVSNNVVIAYIIIISVAFWGFLLVGIPLILAIKRARKRTPSPPFLFQL